MSNYYQNDSHAYPAVINPAPIISGASNMKGGDNPSFTSDDFLRFYKNFQGLVEADILEQFIAMADAVVKEKRWRAMWMTGMRLFIAHFLVLYLETQNTDCSAGASQVIGAAKSRGLQTSKSVGDVSVSYDFSHINQDLKGWASWGLTQYGQQFVTHARMLGKGGFVVW